MNENGSPSRRPRSMSKASYFFCKRILVILPDETKTLGMEDLMTLLREYGNVVKDIELRYCRKLGDRLVMRWLEENLNKYKKVCYRSADHSCQSFMDIMKIFDEDVNYMIIEGTEVRQPTVLSRASFDKEFEPVTNLEFVVHQPSDTNIRNDVESVGIVQQFIHANDLTTLIRQFRQTPRSIGSFFVVHVANPFRWYEVFVSLDANVFDDPRLGRSARVCHTQRYKVCYSDDVELHVDIWDDQTMIQGSIVAKE